MGETEQKLTAITSEYGDERPEHCLGVSIRWGGIEVEYLDATGIEERAPMDWTPDMAEVLLGSRGYEIAGRWIDISEICAEDPIWEIPVALTADPRSTPPHSASEAPGSWYLPGASSSHSNQGERPS